MLNIKKFAFRTKIPSFYRFTPKISRDRRSQTHRPQMSMANFFHDQTPRSPNSHNFTAAFLQ